MTDQQIVNNLIKGDQRTIKNFFFERCKPMLTYIGQYYLRHKFTPEELIGEFYEFLSANDWHKLRIFQYSCSLNSYVTIIASRYFQHKRDKNLDSLDGDISLDKQCIHIDNDVFFIKELTKIVNNLSPFDRFLVNRILLDGEKPRDILDDAKIVMRYDSSVSTNAQTDEDFAGYIYTRYNRIRVGLKHKMVALGYGEQQ